MLYPFLFTIPIQSTLVKEFPWDNWKQKKLYETEWMLIKTAFQHICKICKYMDLQESQKHFNVSSVFLGGEHCCLELLIFKVCYF